MAMQEYFKGLWELVKKNHRGIITIVVSVLVVVYFQACQTTTQSLTDSTKRVSRAELQLELDTLIKKAEIGVADLDRQDAIKELILQNALMLASGGSLNIVGVLSGIAALYGVASAGSTVVSTVKKNRKANGSSTDVV